MTGNEASPWSTGPVGHLLLLLAVAASLPYITAYLYLYDIIIFSSHESIHYNPFVHEVNNIHKENALLYTDLQFHEVCCTKIIVLREGSQLRGRFANRVVYFAKIQCFAALRRAVLNTRFCAKNVCA